MTDSLISELSKTLFIDIETAPLWRSLQEIPPAGFEKEGNILIDHWEKRYTRDRKEDEQPDEHFLNKAAIHAIYGRVVCIGLGWLGPHNGSLTWIDKVLYSLDEKEVLSKFVQIWEKSFLPPPGSLEVATLCGHNLLNFDYIFLGRRLVLNHLRLPRPWSHTLLQPHWTLKEVRLIDTMRMWGMGDSERGSYISLEVLARVLGIPFAKSLTHTDIREAFFAWQQSGNEGDIQPVLKYCLKDVRTMAGVYLRLRGASEEIVSLVSSST